MSNFTVELVIPIIHKIFYRGKNSVMFLYLCFICCVNHSDDLTNSVSVRMISLRRILTVDLIVKNVYKNDSLPIASHNI